MRFIHFNEPMFSDIPGSIRSLRTEMQRLFNDYFNVDVFQPRKGQTPSH